MSAAPRVRPVKACRCVIAFGAWKKDQIIYPQPQLRAALLARRVIVEVDDAPVPAILRAPDPAAGPEPLEGGAKGRKHRMIGPDLLRDQEER